MKKLLVLSLMVGTMAFAVPSVEAKTAAASVAEPQITVVQTRRGNRWNRRVRRSVVSTRIALVNGIRYRETIRTTYRPNGSVRVQVISRTRLGRRNWRNY